MDTLLTSLVFYLFSLNLQLISAKQLTCGFPGTPAYGYVKPDRAAYSEGEVVSYSCRVGYILLGSPISRCTDDGSWSEDVPICDDSMTTLGVAFSTPTVPGNPAELAIDRDKDTCAYLKPKKPRWWRIDLGEEHKVLSVAVTMISPDKYVKFTVFVIKTQGTSASYKRCASFTGKFGTETVVLSCAEGKGIEGQKVHIEDHLQEEGIFEICEVEVQVEKDTGYDCGRPSRSLYSITYEPKNDMVEYGCIRGYEIKGSDYRYCLSTGQWSGDPPICEPILCDDLDDLEHGNIRITHDNDGPPLEGAVAIYKCSEGYKLEGPFTRNCLKDGSWSGKDPQCKAIRCPVPDGRDQGGVYRLINKTNSMGSMAMLRCKGGKREGDNPYIICTEDGEWTTPEAHCILPARAAYESRESPRIENQGVIIFGMVVAAVMIVIVLVAIYLYGQRRNSNKPELPSRSIEPPVPPPRPPPRTNKGAAFKSAFMGLINRDNSGNQEEPKPAWKTQSLPTNHANASDEAGKYSPKRALSYGETLDSQSKDEPAVIQVEVLAHDDIGKKGGRFPPVPEQNEDVSLENVVLDFEDKNNKDSTPKEPRSAASDYAAVDYEKKRQSRLLKEQDSMDSSSTAGASPLPPDEPDKKESRSPTPPKHASVNESEEEEEEEEESETSSVQAKEDIEQQRKAKEEEERMAKEEEERRAKEEKERKAKEEEERKANEEAEKQAKEEEKKKAEAPPGRRRRIRDEPAPPPVEDKPVLRRFRR
ncbi:CUB and sushi domain-containing protein 1 [Araneus ventricosus]|uniref:CUB and sushi domain-containing protein 1 n=1 Tax=Araneus ventricosus TaxID=182803 RepID=A0A4Y2A3G4_ARAVE|nr:CUB and sushi domain-containing protein 1 [Araneus ventricosus]